MRDILNNKIWHLFLAIAFLSMQSASAHIHLASSHEHNGHDHSHTQLVHAHNVAAHHVDDFESAQQTHTDQVVELCQEWIVKYGKCLNDVELQAVLVSSFSFGDETTVNQSYLDNTPVYNKLHFCSKFQARAPPTFFLDHV